MKCANCGASDDHKVTATRRHDEALYRSRKCVCGHRFWTSETVLNGKPPKDVLHRRLENLKQLDAQRKTAMEPA
jgi:transcriptional regulator NrdR family protein